ncbi:MAG: sugar porter family MFS transporter [Gammaproteobacteria bacterium]|nr:sugar porter family MFS transporter [Gammaproteobacteria bacterium]
MQTNTRFTATVSAIVALGGFLMGFDASVISGVVGFIETEFALSKLQVGWAVASLTLTATLGMLVSGPLSDRYGRRSVLQWAALLFLLSAIASALAPGFWTLVAARMLGGLGVGAALIVAPMYIAELSPAAVRGRMVSINQLNIVIGISAAFFSNYLILRLGQSGGSVVEQLSLGVSGWRWMLGAEALPALVYLGALRFVPESPRWLSMHGRDDEALAILARATDPVAARAALDAIPGEATNKQQGRWHELFAPAMRTVLLIGIAIAVVQQITGINAVFFYAPMIFEQSGIGTNAAFMQAVLVGLTNLVFTVVAMMLIDRIGRRPLLLAGLTGITVSMLVLAWGFSSAVYQLPGENVAELPASIVQPLQTQLGNTSFDSDREFRNAVVAIIGIEEYRQHRSALIAASAQLNPMVILVGILGFVASFAVSLGPVMWVLFSELYPNRLRGLAVSFVGLINSGVSFTVQLVFPWELENLGNATTFLLFAIFAILGLVFVATKVPETRGRTLEQLEQQLTA